MNSQMEANKVLRVLSGEKLKYTVRLHMVDGSCKEFQSRNPIAVEWNDNLRERWIYSFAGKSSYEGKFPVMSHTGVEWIELEENPV